MQEFKKVKLILENGIMFQGMSFGYEKSTSGEIVFNTAMVVTMPKTAINSLPCLTV
jgi:hypothetical protein